MRARSTVPALLALGLVLTGCSTDVRGEIRKDVADITASANDRDADAVRQDVEDLLAELDEAVRSGELTSPEAAEIAAIATSVRDRAALLEVAEPEPTPQETSASPSPAPTTSSPTPRPTTRSPEPEEPEEPEPTQEPEPEPTTVPDDVVPTVAPTA